MNLVTEIAQQLRQAGVASKDEEEARRFVEQQMMRLPPHRRGPVAMELKRRFEDEQKESEARKVAAQDVIDWLQSTLSKSIERNDCSRLHKLLDAIRDRHLLGNDAEPFEEEFDCLKWFQHTFVVKHDWAAAFDGADILSGEYRLPFDSCCFEFRTNGRTVILGCAQKEEVIKWTAFVESGDFWCPLHRDEGAIDEDSHAGYLWQQVKAICVSLDAEIATHEVVRAPAALNEKRRKAGKAPLADFHVVDLARRHRLANPAPGCGEPPHRKRLHFVRGHWRHFETHKTWIKWHLRGNPDLGFIAKHYAL